jgi:hypothetical protein
MSVPELKAKKIARAAAWEKAAADGAIAATAEKAALTKRISTRAQQFEAEYAKVCITLS